MIEEIVLRNFLTFREQRLKMAPLTILTGTNSAGKSTVLRSLALVKQSLEARAAELAWPERVFVLNGDLVQLGTGRDVLHADPIEVDAVPPSSGPNVMISIEMLEHGTLYAWNAEYVAEADVLAVRSGDGDDRAMSMPHENFQYLSADRVAPRVTYPKSHDAVVVRGILGARGEHTANYLRVWGEKIIANEACVHPGALSRGYGDQANAWLDMLSAGTSFDVQDVPGTDYVSLRFSRSGPVGKTDLQRATNVGFGLTYSLPVIVGCLAAEPGSLLVVENPEAHLHPAGQALLGNLLARAAKGGAQVVVETHSDHVLNSIRLAIRRAEVASDSVIVHFFSRKSEQLEPEVETLSIGSDGAVPHWPKGFFDQWDTALSELLD